MKSMQPTYSAYTKEDMDALYGTRPATTNAQAIVCPEGYASYTLEAGDTLRSIADARGITVTELLFYNPTLNPYGYKKGDVICVPSLEDESCSATPTSATVATASVEATPDEGTATLPTPSLPSEGDQTPATPGEGTETLPTPSVPAEDDQTPATPGEGPFPLPTPSLPSESDQTPATPGEGPFPLPTPSLPTPSLPATPSCPDGTLYTVRAGDTLRRIAQRFGVTLDALMAANPGQTNNRLIIGQKLCIPCVPCQTGCAQGTTSIRVRSTQFVDYLVNYNISYAALAAANPNVNLDQLVVGSELCIPPAGARGSCGTNRATRELESTVSAAELASQYGITIARLMKDNPNFTPTDFQKGRLVCLPTT